MNLGIDIGRVLISPDHDKTTDTSFMGGTMETAMMTPPFAGMFEVVPALVEQFEGRVWLVSKAHRRMQEKTRLWLAHHRFFERTGIAPLNLHFCLERHEKAIHCRENAITHVIDDRMDVLGYLAGIVTHRILFGPRKPGFSVTRDVVRLDSWPEVARHFGVARA